MDLTPYTYSGTVTVKASPESVYDMVADITRMGEWSPVCTGGEWKDEAHTMFTGTNMAGERSWETVCRVDVAERGSEFTFVNLGMGSADLVRWTYRFAPAGDGTEVTETWEMLPAYPEFRKQWTPDLDLVATLDESLASARTGITETLGRIKAAAES